MLSHDFLSIFVQSIRRLVVLELSSFLPSRVFSVSESLEALFPFQSVFLKARLFTSRFKISVKGVLQLLLFDTIVKRSHLMFLLHKFRPCLIKQMILVSIKK